MSQSDRGGGPRGRGARRGGQDRGGVQRGRGGRGAYQDRGGGQRGRGAERGGQDRGRPWPQRGRGGRGVGGPQDRGEEAPRGRAGGEQATVPLPRRHEPPPAPVPVPEPQPQPGPSREIIALTTSFEKIGRGDLLATPAKKIGSVGRKIALIANHFPITIPDGNLYHYDVDIVRIRQIREDDSTGESKKKGAAPPPPPPPKKGPPTGRMINERVCRQVMDNLFASYQGVFGPHLPAYDGHKNIITRRKLNISVPTAFQVELQEDNDRTSTFKVTIKPVEKEGTGDCAIDLTPLHSIMRGAKVDFPQEAIMALDIVLRHGPALRQVPIGRSFFTPPRNPGDAPDLGEGREIWFGYYQSLRPGQWKPMLNIDKSATTFYSAQSVLDFIGKFIGKNPNQIMALNVPDCNRLSKELRGIQIEVTHLTYPRKYRVLKLTYDRASKLNITIKIDGKEIKTTVEKYFGDTYKKTLLFPNLPCIQAEPKDKNIFLPIEICRITNQHCKKKLTDVQTAEMIKFTATPPAQRFVDIQRSVENTINSSRSYLKEFDLKISSEPLKLTGRVIQPPNVLYDNEKTVPPNNGAWDLRDTKFLTGANIEDWIVMNFSGWCRETNVQKFVEMLCTMSKKLGMNMANPQAQLDFGRDRRQISDIIKYVKAKFPVVTLFIIILDRQSNYSDIKHAAEIREGLLTQCIKAENVVKKCNPQLIANLLQKINAKMGGVNCSLVPKEKLSIFKKPIIIIGADVTHPAPGDKVKPTVAAVVGSMDSYPCRYAVQIRVQKNRDEKKQTVEHIQDLKDMVVKLLKEFYIKTKVKPEKIIFYRDGVSESEFLTVADSEIRMVREACRSFPPLGEYQPQLTFVVVQKRHHTRFMPQNPRDGVGKHKNIPPGTTVDTEVVRPVEFDYYLCSHAGIQGTSRPAHYTVLWDDSDFTADDLQKLTYHLCHIYVRCTRSISIPAPVMYAHLAAFRARQHILSATDVSSASSESSEESIEPLGQDILKAVVVDEALNGKMYFI